MLDAKKLYKRMHKNQILPPQPRDLGHPSIMSLASLLLRHEVPGSASSSSSLLSPFSASLDCWRSEMALDFAVGGDDGGEEGSVEFPSAARAL